MGPVKVGVQFGACVQGMPLVAPVTMRGGGGLTHVPCGQAGGTQGSVGTGGKEGGNVVAQGVLVFLDHEQVIPPAATTCAHRGR